MSRTPFDRIHVDLAADPPLVQIGDSHVTPFEVVDELELGTPPETVLAAYPSLTADDLVQAQAFVAVIRSRAAH